MSSYDLPIILVSASDSVTAAKLFSELIDNEVEDNKYKEVGWRVWQLENKYYQARVRLQALPDDTPAQPSLRADAHLIYLTGNEGARVAEQRRARAEPLLRRAGVRLALLDAACTGTLASWAARARYEEVSLREAPEEGEEEGMARARAALQAHVWPGLRRHGAPAGTLYSTDEEESSDGGSFEEDEEGAVERAEAFAEALGGLGALSEQRDEAGLRCERAEQLVAAFCRALGHDLHQY